MKMKNHELIPVKKWHTNTNYVLDGCGDLPTTVFDDQIVSIWKLKSIWERIKFLFHGEITFSVFSQNQPPICLAVSDTVKRAK